MVESLPPTPHVLRFRPAKVGGILAACIVLLIVLHGTYYLREAMGLSGFFAYSLLPKFDLDGEGTIPAYFSSLLLLIASLLLFWAASGESDRTQRWMWKGLGIVFAYMAIDEAVSLHELVNRPISAELGTRKWFHDSWTLIALPVVVLLGTVYVRFLLRLPKRYALWFVGAGALFVGGAIGAELVGGAEAFSSGRTTPLYITVMTVEEALEMAGVTVFIVGLVSYLANYRPALLLNPEPAGLRTGKNEEKLYE